MLHRFKEFFVECKHDKNALKKFVLATSCLLVQLAATSVYADSDDTINFLIGTDYSHYDNLFLLPDGVNPGTNGERSDNVLRTNFGIKVNKKYALQTFKFDYTHIDNKYDNADFLNFNSNNYKAAWLWSLTPNLSGNLSSERKVDLIPFTDRNSNTQNIRTVEIQKFDFDWSPHHVWHLLGGYTKLESTNSQTFLQETSFKFKAAELGVKYSFPSDNFIAFKLRNRDGENDSINQLNKTGKEFSENEEELSALWQLSAKSRVTANLGHNSHTDNTYALRDFSGYFGGVNYSWDPSAKLNIGVGLTRKLSSYQDNASSYTVNDVLSIKPTWVLTSKIALGGSASVSKRKFLGNGPSPASTASSRVDDGFTYGIQATWTPRSTMSFGVNLQHDERNSNDVAFNRDYSSNMVGVNGQLTF
jgi:exopolysaccharide biosynthesis operon protein EpsL